MVIGTVHPLPVIVVAVIIFLIGFLWYNPKVFGSLWAETLGVRMDEMECSVWHMVGGFAMALIKAWVMALLVDWTAVTSIVQGVTLGFFVWLGFIATTHFSDVLWAKKPYKTYLINVGYELLALIVMGAIFAMWR